MSAPAMKVRPAQARTMAAISGSSLACFTADRDAGAHRGRQGVDGRVVDQDRGDAVGARKGDDVGHGLARVTANRRSGWDGSAALDLVDRARGHRLLVQLAGRPDRHGLDHDDVLGPFLARHAVGLHVLDDLVEGQGGVAGTEQADGAGLFAQLGLGDGDDSDLADGGMFAQHRLDLGGGRC